MIKPGVVLTAGHCVHSGNGASTGWYNSFEFIPAYRRVGSKITQPYGDWTNWASATTTIDWFAGGGGVPNTGDWALIVFNKDANNNRIGDYTGWLGWGYPLQVGRHNTILGYPANLDSAGQLHRVDAAVNDYGSLNNGTYGSDMQGGSSGGPNVLNWRVDYTDTSTLPSENWGNIATSVVSWGYVSSTPKVQGGSQFNATFSNMLTTVCTNYAWAC
jgi:V8-like Glu-specific endopeptidase